MPSTLLSVIIQGGRLYFYFFNIYFLLNYGEDNGTPLQHSCLENPMDGGAWKAAVHGVTKSQTWLSDFTFTFHLHALEKGMATHSSVLAWRIPGMGELGGMPSMGSHRVGHDWLKYSWLTMFQVHSKVIQLYIYTYIIFEIIFHYRLYKILTVVPHAIQ